jgi:hypothetical protein
MPRGKSWVYLLAAVAVAACAAFVWWSSEHHRGRDIVSPRTLPLRPATLSQRLAEIGPRAEVRLRPDFERAGLPFPPAEVRLVAFKDQRRVVIYARSPTTSWRLVRSDAVLAASGRPGPKLAEGDLQVPEGTYRVTAFNPNSRFHVALRLGYPNAQDRAWAARDGRIRLGGDIMIHGKQASIGCLAMGDQVAEDLFVLVARTGVDHVRVIIAPTDLRVGPPPAVAQQPPWLAELYTGIQRELAGLPPG